jgi:hypothetical protein
MFVCVSPVIFNAEETFCSLNFAARVSHASSPQAATHGINMALLTKVSKRKIWPADL